MKKYIYHEPIPEHRVEDVKKLREFIVNTLRIYISEGDTYRFWKSVSESWSAGWLYIDTHYEDQTREEFLLSELEKRGYLLEV